MRIQYEAQRRDPRSLSHREGCGCSALLILPRLPAGVPGPFGRAQARRRRALQPPRLSPREKMGRVRCAGLAGRTELPGFWRGRGARYSHERAMEMRKTESGDPSRTPAWEEQLRLLACAGSLSLSDVFAGPRDGAWAWVWALSVGAPRRFTPAQLHGAMLHCCHRVLRGDGAGIGRAGAELRGGGQETGHGRHGVRRNRDVSSCALRSSCFDFSD